MKVRIAAVFGLLAASAAGAAWLGTELVMAPSGGERTRLISMFAAIAAAVFVVGIALIAVTRKSLNRRLLAVGIAGPLIVAITTLVGAGSMFISSHDTQFVIILTALATVLAVGIVHMLGSPLLVDLRRMTDVAGRLGEGDLSARSELQRSDELGELGVAFDSMAERIEQTAAERERMEEERRFMISSLSHDARTPLTAMRAAVEALQDGMAPDPVRYLDSIEHDLRAIESIVENLFVLAKLDSSQVSPHVESIDLAEIASLAVHAIDPLAQKHEVSLELKTAGPVQALAAHSETERMIGNLLANAIRHSPPDGHVTIEAHCDPVPTISVSDEGPGFDKDFVDKAFEQFVRADAARDRAHGGAGLGLAVVRGLAEAQGGRVWADPGPGGRVTFELPAS